MAYNSKKSHSIKFDDAASVTLRDAPPGLFAHTGSYGVALGFKSEHASTVNGMHSTDAFCFSSGERFWGGAHTVEEREEVRVIPIDVDDNTLISLLGDNGYLKIESNEEGQSIISTTDRMISETYPKDVFSEIDEALDRLETMCHAKPTVLESVCLVNIYASLCSTRHSLQLICHNDYFKDCHMRHIGAELSASIKDNLHNTRHLVWSSHELNCTRRRLLLKDPMDPLVPDEYPVPSDTLLHSEANLIYQIIGTMNELNNNFPRWMNQVNAHDDESEEK